VQAGRAVLLKTTESAQAGVFAPPNPISSRSHNFPNIAPIDELSGSYCGLDPYKEICVYDPCDFQRRSIVLTFSQKSSYILALISGFSINHIDQQPGQLAEWLWR
jgi:hypothetical protein